MLTRGIFAVALAGAINSVLPDPVLAQTDFYAGKTITLMAGLPPGGGVDGEMRVVAHYFPKFIPGHPTIVPKNLPGAGGIILANQLYNNTAPDGLTLAMPARSGFLLSKLVKEPGVNFDLAKFSYIGGAGSTNSILWLRQETGIASITDLKSAKKEIIIGAWAARSQNAVVPRILADYEGWPFKVVHGYPGSNEVQIALERGEIDGVYVNEGSIQNTRPYLISSGKIKAMAQSFEDIPNVPILTDVIANPKEKALISLLNTPARIGLPLLAPPGIPAERLELLRKSYAELVQDKEYRAEAERRGLPVGRAMGGAELQKLVIDSLSTVPEDVLQEYLNYTQEKRSN